MAKIQLLLVKYESHPNKRIEKEVKNTFLFKRKRFDAPCKSPK
jgi:hypothetical protein